MGKDVGIVRVDMIFKGHVSKTETEMNILWRNWSIQSGRRSAGIICCSPVIRWSSRCPEGQTLSAFKSACGYERGNGAETEESSCPSRTAGRRSGP